MQLLRAAQHRRMAWKNGAGETTEIAVWPPGAGLDDFEWRISMARIASAGPFSVFPGVERTLALLSGDGLRLLIGDAAPVDLHVGAAPLSFPADVPTTATLLGGAVTDLNVMSRRGAWSHRVEVLRLAAGTSLAVRPATTVWWCAHGRVHLRSPAGSAALEPGDACLVVDHPALTWELATPGSAFLVQVTLQPERHR